MNVFLQKINREELKIAYISRQLLMYNTSMVSFDGGSASKFDDVTALPSRYKMADMCYYGNVMTTTRWRLYVTMETLWQQQDGGYALL